MGMREVQMQRWSDKYCKECGKRMNKWDERCQRALRTAPMCENDLAKKFDKSIPELNEWLDEVYHIRRCQFK